MQQDSDGSPLLARSATGLGIRIPDDPYADISVTWGRVDPMTGGMSVALDDPALLPDHRRPPWLNGGTSDYPLFKLRESALSLGLKLVPSEPPPGHAEVQPARSMSIQTYERLLRETKGAWEPILGEP
jgi:hypothetical protein